MAECLAAPEQPESAFDAKALSEAIGRFLDTEKAEVRVMFMLRYWACLSIEDVAEECSVRS